MICHIHHRTVVGFCCVFFFCVCVWLVYFFFNTLKSVFFSASVGWPIYLFHFMCHAWAPSSVPSYPSSLLLARRSALIRLCQPSLAVLTRPGRLLHLFCRQYSSWFILYEDFFFNSMALLTHVQLVIQYNLPHHFLKNCCLPSYFLCAQLINPPELGYLAALPLNCIFFFF